MSEALRLGLSAAEFWEMSPRAIFLLLDVRLKREERRAGRKGRQVSGGGARMNYIPHG